MQQKLFSDTLEILINSSGAEICSVKNTEGLEFIWQGQKDIWPRHAPVLFPIVGKLKDNTFIFKDRAYELGQHGFARDRNFMLTGHGPSACTFELRADPTSKEIYPFDFVFQIRYELDHSTLSTHYKIFNPSADSLLFSVGAHPAFRCPLLASESFEDYYLEFGSSVFELRQLNNGLRLGDTKEFVLKDQKLYLSKALFEKDALVFEKSQIDQIRLCSDKSAHKITMTCPDWPYFGIWSKKGCDAFVCLEPWYGIADAEVSTQQLHRKEGILTLNAGEAFDCSFSITFD